MVFCGNIIEIVEKYKILDDKEEFVRWIDIEDILPDDQNLQVFIEKSMLPELTEQNSIKIDLVTFDIVESGGQFDMLFIKKQNNVYG